VIEEAIELDLITIVLIVASILAAICIVGIVRNWNKGTGTTNASGPQIHLTLVGWILALFAVGVVITSIILAWQAGWLPRIMLRGIGKNGIVAMGVFVGLLCFYVPALLLHALGVRAWRSEKTGTGEVSPSKPKRRQLRYRLGENQQDNKP